jgi:hypothetical protein
MQRQRDGTLSAVADADQVRNGEVATWVSPDGFLYTARLSVS